MRAQDLANLAGTTVRTIRYYHQLGLLGVPESGATWRSYGFTHLTRLMRIRWLVESGVPLAEVPHMLRPPGSADERSLVVEDLDAVLTSIDQKVAVLTAQRERVESLLERVSTQGRLSPIPPPILRLYGELLERPLPPAMREAMQRERDLVELACYRKALPRDIVTLVDALRPEDVDEVCALWEECHGVSEAAGLRLSVDQRARIAEVVRRTVDLAIRAEPEAAHRLLARAAELDRPAVRAAVELAYPSPAYRQFVIGLVGLAKERSTP